VWNIGEIGVGKGIMGIMEWHKGSTACGLFLRDYRGVLYCYLEHCIDFLMYI
jgi:hypothetical protein